MPHRNKLIALLSTLLAGTAAAALAQTPDYYQGTSSSQGYGKTRSGIVGAGGNAALIIERLPSTFRVPVRTTPDSPLYSVTVLGAREVYCAQKAAFDAVAGVDYIKKKFNDSGGELNFQELLYKKLSTLDAAAIQTTLQRAEKAERAAAYRELFGAELPPLTGEWPFSIDNREVREQEQMQLNMGRELKVEVDSVVCATPAQVDAAIATAKQVYAAAVAAMQKPAKQGASSGLQAR
jgi:hypothetical protein